MDLNKNLILVKGEDKTEQIQSWSYENGRINVTYNNRKTYPYGHYSVDFYKDPHIVNANQQMALVDQKPLSNVERIQKFERHIRVFYKTGYHEIFDLHRVEFIDSSLTNPKTKNCFDYLKQIADIVGLKTDDDKNILTERYKKINFIREDSVLSAFLNFGETLPKSNRYPEAIVYPFGFNISQKDAVDHAMKNQLSIIEGPPGTGKTQTILNIIANAVMSGQSVAVVSSNNSATANVLDKLKKYGVDFIAAYLGNTDNKQEFINSQSAIPDLSRWQLTPENQHAITQKIANLYTELNTMLEKKNELSMLTGELDAITLEQKHFLQYYEETNDKDTTRMFRKTSSAKCIQLWLLCESYCQKEKKIGFWEKALNFFRYGIKDKSFYELSPDRMIALCQMRYYENKTAELKARIKKIQSVLSAFSFDEKMKEYSALSMDCFKNKLRNRCQNQARKTYELDDLWKRSDEFITDYPVVLSTTYSLRSSLSNQFVFDYVIVDEASQVDLATGALALSCAKKAVIVGDLKQLPNVVDSKTEEITNRIFDKFSLPETYRYSDHSLLLSITQLFPDAPKTLLREHYRCHPKIIDFCNKKFYDDQLIILTEAKDARPPLVVYKTVEGNHARERMNQRQIDVIKNEIIPEQKLDLSADSVGIVTPYRNQTNLLQSSFSDTNIKADTVDKFQGQENDIIILSTVDNDITDFTDNANRLNVAVSRAIKQLILVVNGKEASRDTNIGDLIAYIEYQNLEIIESKVYSVFDYLYKNYAEKRAEFLKHKKRISEYDSENLMYSLIQGVLRCNEFAKYEVAVHVPLKMILRGLEKLDDDETKYAMNILTHVDFLIFDKMGKSPVLAIEVDGFNFHHEGTKQAERDKIKNSILEKYALPLIRFSTTGSGEKEQLMEALKSIQGRG